MKKRVILMLIVVLVSGMLLALFSSRQPDLAPPIQLADGSTLTFFDVSFGTNHVKVDPPWKRWMGLVPGRLVPASWLPAKVEISTTSCSLVLWEHWQNRTMTGRRPEFFIEDENGFASSTQDVQEFSNRGGSSRIKGATLGAFSLPTWPRRSAAMTIHVIQSDSSGKPHDIGQIKIPNPLHEVYPVWKPEPLPATKKAGDIEVTLEQLFANADAEGRESPAAASEPARSAAWARFTFRTNGVPVKNWAASIIRISDSTGNESVPFSYYGDMNDAMKSGVFSCELWPTEPAWKLEVALHRLSGFSENELLRLEGIPFQAEPYRRGVVSMTTNFQGSPVTIYKVEWREGSDSMAPEYTLLFKTGLPTNIVCTVMQATDERGNRLAEMGRSYGTGRNAGLEGAFIFEDNLGRPRPKFLNVTVAFQNPPTVQFIVKPEVLKNRLESKAASPKTSRP